MKTLRLSVKLSAMAFIALVLPFLLFNICGLRIPRMIEIIAVWSMYLLPVVIVLLVIYVNAVGIRVFLNGVRSHSKAKVIQASVFLVIVGFIVAGIFRLLWRK